MGTRYAVLTCSYDLCFFFFFFFFFFQSKNMKNFTVIHPKIAIFTAVKNRSILHGRVNIINTSASMVFVLSAQRT